MLGLTIKRHIVILFLIEVAFAIARSQHAMHFYLRIPLGWPLITQNPDHAGFILNFVGDLLDHRRDRCHLSLNHNFRALRSLVGIGNSDCWTWIQIGKRLSWMVTGSEGQQKTGADQQEATIAAGTKMMES